MTREPYDFAIIGAGIAGASAAYELATRGSVLILEAESQPGYHTTGRSAAFFSEAYGKAVIRALTRGSRTFLESPPAGFCEHSLLVSSGAMFVGRDDQAQAIESYFEEISDLGESVSLSDGALAEKLVPVFRDGYVSQCIWEPDARAIDVNELLQAYLRCARTGGATLIKEARVTGLSRINECWNLVTGQGEFFAATLINAAGAWADKIGELAGANSIGLEPMRRTVCLFDPPAGQDISGWPLVIDIDEQFYFKPDAGKILLSPADETPMPPQDVHPDDLDIAIAVDRLEKATTLNVAKIDHRWAGLRSFVRDRSPVAGFDSAVDRFFWLAGQGGYGISTAPGMARCTAALCTGMGIPSDLRRLGITEDKLSPRRCQSQKNYASTLL